MSRFEILEVRRLDRYLDLTLRGRCTAHVAEVLHDTLAMELDEPPRALLLDVSGLEEIEGPCVHELVLATRQLRQRRGALVLYGLGEEVAASLRDAGLLDDLATFATWTEAREAADDAIQRARRVDAATRILSRVSDTATLSRRSLRHSDGERVGELVRRILS